MRITIRVLAVVILLVTSLNWVTTDASACSYVQMTAEEKLEWSHSAFIGYPLARYELAARDAPKYTNTLYEFKVEIPIKGEFGDQQDVYASFSGASCGFEGAIVRGARSGIFLREDGGLLIGGLCSTSDADELLTAVGLDTPEILALISELRPDTGDLVIHPERLRPDSTSQLDDEARLDPTTISYWFVAVAAGLLLAAWISGRYSGRTTDQN